MDHISLKKKSSYLGWAYLMLNLWKLVSSFGSTTYLVQVLWFAFALCNLALVEGSRCFWGSDDAIFVHSSIVHGPSSSTIISFSYGTIFLFFYSLCVILGASVCFYFQFVYVSFLVLAIIRIHACLFGRETRSAFS